MQHVEVQPVLEEEEDVHQQLDQQGEGGHAGSAQDKAKSKHMSLGLEVDCYYHDPMSLALRAVTLL